MRPAPVELRPIEPGSSEFAAAAELRYQTLYADLGFARSKVEEADRDEGPFVHVAVFVEDRLAGYARLKVDGAQARISQVCVDSDARGTGLGAALVRDLVRRAAGAGCEEVVLDARIGVIGFYERLGFVAHGPQFPSRRTGTPHQAMSLRLEKQGLFD